MTRRKGVDYTPNIIATAVGFISYALLRLGFIWIIWILLIVIGNWPWLLIPFVPFLVTWMVATYINRRKVKKRFEQRHRERYGKDPQPWTTHPIHRPED